MRLGHCAYPCSETLKCVRLVTYLLIGLLLFRTPVGSAQGAPPPANDSLAVAAYRDMPSAMSTARFAALWQSAPAAFRRAWDSAATAERVRLAGLRDSLAVQSFERERLRIEFRYLWGRVVWPYFHWRETDARSVAVDSEAFHAARRLPLADSRWWELSEHRELVSALVHERARVLLRDRPALRRGDARWLRAEFMAVAQLFTDVALKRDLSSRLLLAHLDDNDERGIDSVLSGWYALGPDAALRTRVDSVVAAAKALRHGHRIVPYTVREGVALELHVLRPLGGDTSAVRPAMLWFHGGSGTTGSWSHSPGVVRALRENGVTVIAVEYRTGSRFDAGPVEQYADAVAAYRYARTHATALLIDPQRIGASGFSSGAGLALLLGTRGVHLTRPAPAAGRRVYPAAVVVSGACVDPAGPSEDGYFRKRVQAFGSPRDYSPLHLLSASQPKALVIHATNDEYCAYESASAFVTRSRALGNTISLVTIEGASHFFGFYFRPGQEQMRQAIAAALAAWNWQGRGRSSP